MSARAADQPEGDGGADLEARVVVRALAEQRDELTRGIDDQVLQYACVALQELQDIHRAQPAESLWRAIGNLHNVITRLRGLVDAQTDDRLRERAARVVEAARADG